jgi:hypothetical protein
VSGLRRGVLSTASIAKVVSAANPDRFRAVAGRDPDRTAAFATATGIERTFDGYAAMLGRRLIGGPPAAGAEIDAVYAALPTAMHTTWTVAALEAGKHGCARNRSRGRRPTRRAASTPLRRPAGPARKGSCGAPTHRPCSPSG